MRHTFTLVYEIPLDLIYIEPAMNELAKVGLRGGGQNETDLSLWFSYEADTLLDAIDGARQAVTKALPRVRFVSVKLPLDEEVAMQTTQQRIEYLERQLAQVQEFIARDTARLAEVPGDFAFQLSLRSWESHRAEIQRDLALLREAKVQR